MMKNNGSNKKGIVNLKNEMIVDITKPMKKVNEFESKRISARVTIGDPDEIFNDVDIKIKSMKFKKVLKGNLWYIAMCSLNKILDNIDASEIEKNKDLMEFLNNKIDELFEE